MILSVLVAATLVVWMSGKTTVRRVPRILKWVLVVAGFAYGFSNLKALGDARREMAKEHAGKSQLVHEPWKEWSPEAQARAISAGKTVVVNFTAGWCVTCKVNETVVFDREAAKRALAGESVVALLADWTNGDPAITAALSAVGRNSVPVYLVYKPGASAPKVLPQILTLEGFLRELR
jgi:thiol:disulfide interchange protein